MKWAIVSPQMFLVEMSPDISDLFTDLLVLNHGSCGKRIPFINHPISAIFLVWAICGTSR